MKYSTFEGVVAWSGGDLLVKGGQKFDDQHPLVKERPDLFRDVSSDTEAEETQTATAANRQVESTMQTGPGGGRFQKKSGQ